MRLASLGLAYRRVVRLASLGLAYRRVVRLASRGLAYRRVVRLASLGTSCALPLLAAQRRHDMRAPPSTACLSLSLLSPCVPL